MTTAESTGEGTAYNVRSLVQPIIPRGLLGQSKNMTQTAISALMYSGCCLFR
jgi:hypothetical protein